MATTEATPASGGSVVSRIFESLPDGFDYVVDEIDGTLPPELTGTLYRNGPGKTDIGGTPLNHLFDGDGMLSQVIFDGKRVRYRNRFVETKHYLAERTATKPRYRRFGTDKPGGPLANAFRLPRHNANTSVVLQAGNLLALWEGSRPYSLDPDSLATIGEHDFDGQLKRAHAFSAHPKWDPATGDLFNFGLQYGPKTRIRNYRVDRSGRLHHLQTVTMPHPVWNHDFALTAKHMVFVLDPLTVNLPAFLFGFRTFDASLRWDPSKPTYVVLVPRGGGPVRVVECEPFYHVHVSNAFEDGSDIVVDLCRYHDFEFGEFFRNYRDTPSLTSASALVRLRITPNNRVEASELCSWSGEFPQLDQRRSTRENRFTYYAGNPDRTDYAGAILKVDNQNGDSWAHQLGSLDVVGEPIFVPRHPDAAEDDGWLLAMAYSPLEHRSKVIIVDARDLEGEPLAVAHLRHHVPPDFHGTFTRRIATP
jgi:all-trans-8'-apo-beta-carotenal 15,15'-oxygenase